MTALRLLTPVLVLVPVVLLLGVSPLWAGGQREPKTAIALYLEAGQGSHPKMVFRQLVAGQERTFHRVPEVSSPNIAAFKPFPAEDGQTFGVLLQVKPAVVNRLSAITAANLEKWMIASVNGRIVDALLIDQQIRDGKWVIWKGLTAAEIAQLDESVPRIGERKPRG